MLIHQKVNVTLPVPTDDDPDESPEISSVIFHANASNIMTYNATTRIIAINPNNTPEYEAAYNVSFYMTDNRTDPGPLNSTFNFTVYVGPKPNLNYPYLKELDNFTNVTLLVNETRTITLSEPEDGESWDNPTLKSFLINKQKALKFIEFKNITNKMEITIKPGDKTINIGRYVVTITLDDQNYHSKKTIYKFFVNVLKREYPKDFVPVFDLEEEVEEENLEEVIDSVSDD